MRINYTDWAVATSIRLNIGTYCALCARSAMPRIDLCGSCHQWLKSRRHMDSQGIGTTLCLGCGRKQVGQYSASVEQDYCGDCALEQGSSLRRIVAPYQYVYPFNELIKRIKYRQDRQLARVLGTLLAQAVLHDTTDVLPEILLPMPLHPDRLQQRGFNQARDIAMWCGKRLDLPVPASQVSRIVDTGSLAGLNRQERRLRILGAFRACDALAGRRVAIVDDVLTTGASARELAREIYDSGAESVELWVLARTSSNRD